MFEQYPKTRPVLPRAYEEIYRQHYIQNRGGRSAASALSQRLESWMHRRVAADVKNSRDPGATLEIGAGNLNHVAYEPASQPYDIVEPSAYLFQEAPKLAQIRNIYSDVRQIPVDQRYERIVSIATLEHLCDLPEVIAHVGLLMQPQGTFRVAIPSEGTAPWRWAQLVTTGLEFRLKYGLDYKVLRRYEHVNTAEEIEGILNQFFNSIKSQFYGLSRRLSLYQFFVCATPRLNTCKAYIEERAGAESNRANRVER